MVATGGTETTGNRDHFETSFRMIESTITAYQLSSRKGVAMKILTDVVCLSLSLPLPLHSPHPLSFLFFFFFTHSKLIDLTNFRCR